MTKVDLQLPRAWTVIVRDNHDGLLAGRWPGTADTASTTKIMASARSKNNRRIGETSILAFQAMREVVSRVSTSVPPRSNFAIRPVRAEKFTSTRAFPRTLSKRSGMLDEYIALPPLRCPLCCQSIPSWEGRDGPREGLSWRQGTSRPEGADGQELDESLRALRLPQQFRLRATCGCSGQQRLLDAVGECTQETWTSTRLLPLRPSVDDSRETMEQIIGEEMADIRDEAVLSAVRKGLVHPELHQREWDYSATRVVYPCWWVARFPQINQGLVYSEHGHAYNWGAIELDSNWFGMDACWHGSLEEAFALFIHRRLSGVQWRKDQWA